MPKLKVYSVCSDKPGTAPLEFVLLSDLHTSRSGFDCAVRFVVEQMKQLAKKKIVKQSILDITNRFNFLEDEPEDLAEEIWEVFNNEKKQ